MNKEQLQELIAAGKRLDSAMDMQEKRETGEFHLHALSAKAIWMEARRAWEDALEQISEVEDLNFYEIDKLREEVERLRADRDEFRRLFEVYSSECHIQKSRAEAAETDAGLWRKHKHLFVDLSALFEQISPVLTKRIELQNAALNAQGESNG